MSRQKLRPAPLALAIALALGGAAVHAQGIASPDAPVQISIKAQPLAEALNDWARQTRIQLMTQQSLVAGKTAPAVSGTLTPNQALNRLLAGSGLTAMHEGNAVVIKAAASVGGTALPEVLVRAAPEQDATTEGTQSYTTRSVTSAKGETPLLEIPQSVVVVTRQQMDDQQPFNPGDAVTYYNAGVQGNGSGADPKQAEAGVQVRGFSTTEYVDGLPVPAGTFARPAHDPYMLDRVELLKGATAAVYGQNQPGGILQLTSKRPTEEPLHEVFLQGGSYGRIAGGFDVGGPIDTDKRWLYRITGVAYDSGTQVDHTNLSRVSIAPSLTFRPDSSTSLTILASYRNDPNTGFWNKRPAVGSLVPNADGYRIPDNFFTGDLGFNKLQSKQASIGYAFEHHFDSGWTFRQNLRQQYLAWHFDSVQDDKLVGTTIIRDKFQDINNAHLFSVDNQAEKTFTLGDFKHKTLLGLDYQHVNYADKETDADAPSLDLLYPIYRQPLPVYTANDTYINTQQTVRDLGVYAHDEISFGGWRASMGARHDWANSSTTDLLNDNSRQTQSSSATTWNAGLLYLFDNGIAPYVSYSTSFMPTVGTDVNSKAFKPTTGQQYEAGVKYKPAAMDAIFSASVYQLTQQNVLTQDLNNSNNRVQTGEVRSNGFDIGVQGRLTKNVNLLASYAYIDARTTKSNSGTKGYRPSGIPRNSANAWATYKFTEGALGGVKVGAGARYIGSTMNTANTATIPGVTVSDAMLSYDFGFNNPSLKGLTLAVNASNIFDRKYIQTCTNGCWYGLRRNVVATLKYNW
ncbi:MAG: TonB-dependent siderophore receptor [Acidovorax sp.]